MDITPQIQAATDAAFQALLESDIHTGRDSSVVGAFLSPENVASMLVAANGARIPGHLDDEHDPEQTWRCADLHENPPGVRVFSNKEDWQLHQNRKHGPTPAELMEHDPVNHPSHYTSHPSGVECITITRHMTFNLGNVVKYVWRADEKDVPIQDLEKAAWYLQDEIERRRAG